ncbi:helix-turn-helix domain-containing protein [Actinomyces succiniciruminis]|uniref:Homeodomain-like n=1 Tax=Actinomyces succiniciruminis TaxID=1522002 RepID=A0A1L7RL36_9ACTO|nr:helix-turn-helix domain-containing protein [Actinomyces succiniciruminis]CED90272.1 Homeodomain-like [Actinomyces succiniciruminis]
MHDRAAIRRLSAQGLGPSAIARQIGCSRSSVYRALAPDAALSYRRQRRYDIEGAAVDELLAAWPRMTAVALAARSGWSGSLRQLQREVHVRRSAAIRAADASGVVIRPAPIIPA